MEEMNGKTVPRMYGCEWTEEEFDRLRNECIRGISIKEMSIIHGRAERGIIYALCRIGVLKEEEIEWKSAEEISTTYEVMRTDRIVKIQRDIGYRFFKKGEFDKAVEWWTKAAEQGDLTSQLELGRRYSTGKGVPRDYSKAAEWWTKATERGDLYSRATQRNIGYRFLEWGECSKAVEWWTKAAEQGDMYSQFELGLCYSTGQGVPVDFVKATEWLTKAAEQGEVSSQAELGVCYAIGQGVPRDYVKATEWLTNAAEQGDMDSQSRLAECYRNGWGVTKNLDKAEEWEMLANEQKSSLVNINAGNAWSKEEEDQLKAAYLDGKSRKELSELHGRTQNAIWWKLLRMGLLEYKT